MPDKAFIQGWSNVEAGPNVGELRLLYNTFLLRDTDPGPVSVGCEADILSTDNVATIKSKIAECVRQVATDSGYTLGANAVIFPDFSKG